MVRQGDYQFETKTDREGNLCIESCQGSGYQLTLPEKLFVDGEERLVTALGKKALLGLPSVREIYLPGTIREIGDYALASCPQLTSVVATYSLEKLSLLKLGRSILKGSSHLKRLQLLDTEDEHLSHLLASAITLFPAQYLLRTYDLGDLSWYQGYDTSLGNYLREEDYVDLSSTIPCGEEDISYDGIGSVDGEMPTGSGEQLLLVRMDKAYLALLRLRYDKNLGQDMRSFYKQYLRKGQQDGVGPVMLSKLCMEDIPFYETYLQAIDAVDEDYEKLLNFFGAEYPQVRAFLIGKRMNIKKEGGSLFDDFFI